MASQDIVSEATVVVFANEDMTCIHQEAMALVSKNGMKLRDLVFLRSDREIVLAAVTECGEALQFAAKDLRGDRCIALAAIAQHGTALQYASEELRADREVVLAAVSHHGEALEYAAESLRADREVVLAAIANNGLALLLAADVLKTDRETVLAAVTKHPKALRFAADSFLQDETFAIEARQHFYFIRVSLLSGRHCIVAALGYHDLRDLLNEVCTKLNMQYAEKLSLLHGTDVVPIHTFVEAWPGSPARAVITDYQLLRRDS
eukprot:5870677-Amphidinium_carterae.1